jgi:hypothetical protein
MYANLSNAVERSTEAGSFCEDILRGFGIFAFRAIWHDTKLPKAKERAVCPLTSWMSIVPPARIISQSSGASLIILAI